jgi:uncharacterized protein YbcI
MATIETDHAGTRRGQISSDISTQAVQIVHEYTGRGPTKARTVLNHDSVTIILQDSLTKGELKLVEAGRGDEVLRTRHAYQQVMRQDLTRIVEKALDRKVIAFLSDNHAVPDVAIEFFLLEPQTDTEGPGVLIHGKRPDKTSD